MRQSFLPSGHVQSKEDFLSKVCKLGKSSFEIQYLRNRIVFSPKLPSAKWVSLFFAKMKKCGSLCFHVDMLKNGAVFSFKLTYAEWRCPLCKVGMCKVRQCFLLWCHVKSETVFSTSLAWAPKLAYANPDSISFHVGVCKVGHFCPIGSHVQSEAVFLPKGLVPNRTECVVVLRPR